MHLIDDEFHSTHSDKKTCPTIYVFLVIFFSFVSHHLPISGNKVDLSTVVEGLDQKPKSHELARFRTEVDQVVIYASIYDKESQLVSGLVKDEFTVYEDNIEQELTHFGQDDVPCTVGLVIDTSGSMRNKFNIVNEAAQLFLSMNNPHNQSFLIAFKSEAILEEDFTQDIEDIRDGLDNLIVSGGTALYDAIYLAVDKARQGNKPKKTVIVFTDGEDKNSYYTYEQLLDKTRESDVQVYIVAFLDLDFSNQRGFFGIGKSKREKVEKKINTISTYTGGKAFFPNDTQEFGKIFQSIAYELRHQYRLAYVSSNQVWDGTWRDIDVVVKNARRRGLKVRNKKGYLAKKE